MLSNKNLCCI